MGEGRRRPSLPRRNAENRGPRGGRTSRRTLRLTHGSGIAEVDEPAGPGRRRRTPAGLVCPAARGTDGGWLDCGLRLTDLRDLSTAVQRLRRLFDPDAAPYAVAERLGADPLPGPLVAEGPGWGSGPSRREIRCGRKGRGGGAAGGPTRAAARRAIRSAGITPVPADPAGAYAPANPAGCPLSPPPRPQSRPRRPAGR
ncbi:AlkA N-terminal domain-containing protein [Streptomyces tubercidicus]|uniref:AlkA N-terminal domain-containing protein n=1 Tax=Streptomyces tubercidicus TaxID=47759 RepID=UPI00399B8424